MTDTWHGYVGIELLNITNGQREALIAAFKALRGVNPQGPQHINHWRIRADRNAAIFEARFDKDNLTVASITNFLASAVGVSPAVISSDTTQTARGPLVVFSAGGTDRLRMIAFAGTSSMIAESHTQAYAYIAANLVDWDLKIGA